MKKALCVVLLYTAALAFMASAPVRIPQRCSTFPTIATSPASPVPSDLLRKDKQLLPKKQAKICWSFRRWCVYKDWGCFEPEIPNRCEGEGYGGGGGNAF